MAQPIKDTRIRRYPLAPTYRVAAANRRVDPNRTVDTWLIIEDDDGAIHKTQETFASYQKAQHRAEVLNRQCAAERLQALY